MPRYFVLLALGTVRGPMLNFGPHFRPKVRSCNLVTRLIRSHMYTFMKDLEYDRSKARWYIRSKYTTFVVDHSCYQDDFVSVRQKFLTGDLQV